MLKTIKRVASAIVNSHLIKDEGGWIQFAIPVAMAVASYLNNKKGNRQTQQQSTNTSGTSTPTAAPQYSPLQQQLIDRAMASLQAPTSLPRGYEEQGIRGINRTYDMAEQGLANNLTARGLGGSPIAGNAESRLAGGRASDIVQFQSSLPLVQRQMQQEDLASAMSLLNMGMGNSSTGTGSMTGTNRQWSGSPYGAAIGSLAQMMAFMYGQGAYGGGGGGVMAGGSAPR